MARFHAALGAVGSSVAVFVPWSHYGDIDIPLTRFPFWPAYVASAVVLHIAVVWMLFERSQTPRVVGVVAGWAAIGAAVVLGFNYDNSSELFSGIVPLVVPKPGFGPFIAVLAAGLTLVPLIKRRALVQPA